MTLAARTGKKWFLVFQALALQATALTALGCSSETTAPKERFGGIRVDAEWVTPPVAASVNTVSGLFVLEEGTPQIVTKIAADSIALAVARITGDPRFPNSRRSDLERARGASIPFAELTPCARPVYATAPFEMVPAAAPGWLRRGLASQWSIQLCGRRSPDVMMSVMVPDALRDFAIANDTIVVASLRQFGGGGDWFVSALPRGFSEGLLLTPEEAVRTTFLSTGVRVSKVPRPVYQWDDRKNDNRVAAHVSWLVTLERPVQVFNKESNAMQVVSQLIVQRRELTQLKADFFVPASVQPSQRWFSFSKDTTGTSSSTELDSVLVRVRGLHRFNAVDLVR